MNEIIIRHNGVDYTEEDIIAMLDLVMEIVGEIPWEPTLLNND